MNGSELCEIVIETCEEVVQACSCHGRDQNMSSVELPFDDSIGAFHTRSYPADSSVSSFFLARQWMVAHCAMHGFIH